MPQTPAEVRRLVSGLIELITRSLHYEESVEKSIAWGCLLSMFSNNQCFGNKLETVCFFPTMPIIFQTDNGVSLSTVSRCGKQVNVNVVIPRQRAALPDLLSDVKKWLGGNHSERRMNLSPTCSHLPISDQLDDAFQRVLPRTLRMDAATFVPETMTLHYQGSELHVIKWVRDRRELRERFIRDYKPLTLMHIDDWPGKVYWSRARIAPGSAGAGDVALVALCNPATPMIDTDLFTRHARVEAATLDLPTRIADVVRALAPSEPRQVAQVIIDVSVPTLTRAVVLWNASDALGLRDELIALTSVGFTEALCASSCTFRDMYKMSLLMRQSATMKPGDMAKGLDRILAVAQDQDGWRAWALGSGYVRGQLRRLPAKHVMALVSRHAVFADVLVALLVDTLGEWGAVEREKATGLLALNPDRTSREMKKIHEEHARITDEANIFLLSLETPEAAPGSRRSGARRRAARRAALAADGHESGSGGGSGCGGGGSGGGGSGGGGSGSGAHRHTDRAPGAADPSPPHSHRPVVEELQARHPQFAWHLIGSGHFHARGDLDLVVEAEGETLVAAYDAVRAATGFHPRFDDVDGEHVAILRGVFGKLPVDVQVCRRDGDTRAERLTHATLGFTRRLVDGIDERLMHRVDRFHAVCDLMGLKNHLLCRFPGIAITVLTVVFGCREEWSISNMLSDLRDVLERNALVDFETQTVSVASERKVRSDVPSIVANELNLVTRLTRATSMHAFDAITFFLANSPASEAQMRNWRRTTMFRALIVRPASPRSISHNLFVSVQSFQQHPCVETIFVDEERDDVLVVMCTLRTDSDAERYGFRSTDSAVADGNNHAHVVRNGLRSLSLLTSPREGRVMGSGVNAWKPIGNEMCVPNVPTLTIDALMSFPGTAFEVVFE
ncbi:MAG: hypothetical protein CMM02_00280 [Rhodopirellula sp.]|nr:hypothetical protein [Rhodopirellula sp.]